MEKIILQNNVPLIIKDNKLTPRVALSICMGFNKKEKFAGEIALIKALLFQGTKTRSGEKLAKDLEENGINCYVISSKDYICLKLLCLNEDFETAIDILQDIIFNSTFEEYEKEKNKIKGEILSDLDSPQVQAFDEFSKTIFANHSYGNTSSVILEQIDKTSKDDIKEFYNQILNNSKKNIVVVGDIEKAGGKEKLKTMIDLKFSSFTTSEHVIDENLPELCGKKIQIKTKKDSAQAQVIQGWIFPTMLNEDFPAITVMNTILGSSGLSSRLFQELREKKGLAYTVRSCYETFKQCGCLWVYIGTNPVNIQTAVDGFKTEIDKLKTDYVTEEELSGGKNNIFGKRQYILETNIQQASSIGMYELLGVGYDYEEKLIQKIMQVTAEDIRNSANKYFTDDFVLYALASEVSLKL